MIAALVLAAAIFTVLAVALGLRNPKIFRYRTEMLTDIHETTNIIQKYRSAYKTIAVTSRGIEAK